MEIVVKQKDRIKNNCKSNSFRTIHYLGSKLRILNSIKEIVNELDPDKHGICDLFSGTGVVSHFFSNERKVVASDIQNYSNVICSALLAPPIDGFPVSFVESVRNSKLMDEYLSVFEPLIEIENDLINNDLNVNLESVSNFIENASLYAYLANETNENILPELKEAFQKTAINLSCYPKNSFIATKYLGGVYFSFKQSVILDVIISEIEKTDVRFHHTLNAALLSTASDIVNTVGKHFAQPIRPRNKNGKPKKGLVKQLKKDRDLDTLTFYNQWLVKYRDNQVFNNINHKVIKEDYKKVLKNLDDDIKIIYADPPYTRDHYSRFYHGLETLSLKDYPKISKTKIKGKTKLTRGLYRTEREQSVFCIRSKAPQAFEDIFKLASIKGKTLILSYSPYSKAKGAHPRVIEIELLEDLANKYFNNVEIQSIENFSHSKLNKTELHLYAEESAELFLICQNR